MIPAPRRILCLGVMARGHYQSRRLFRECGRLARENSYGNDALVPEDP